MYLPLFMAYANKNIISNRINSVQCESIHDEEKLRQKRLEILNDKIIIKHYLTEEHRYFINQYRISENPNPSIFVQLDRDLFLKYGIEFTKRNRPIIQINEHYNVDYSNLFIY